MSEFSSSASKEPLAVVGIGCRLPGDVLSPNDLWKMLLNKTDCIVDVPKDRWDVNVFYDPDPTKSGRIKSRQGGFIKDIDKFDGDFFGYFPEEAAQLDPQQRMALEVAYEALEDAGIPLEDASGSKTSVFISGFLYDHLCMQLSSAQRDIVNPYAAMGVGVCSLANRISYCLNLKGPSVAVDTACSGSLVALHMACRSIWDGDAEAALAGGVNALLKPESSIVMSKAGFLSPDARCKAFDASANGYVRSEGSAIVYIKKLSKALEDNDDIYGVIKGTAVNSDGHTPAGFTVPDKDAQINMLRSAYDDAKINPSNVAYVEAHGPGTPVGDPIETGALGEVIGKGRDVNNKFIVGSIKTNIGHLEGASGIAGFVKATISLKNRQVPANLHFNNPNPTIPFDDYRIQVATDLTDIPQLNNEPPVIGVNSFGAGGTNAHIVMQGVDAVNKEQSYDFPNGQYIFVISAKTLCALKDYAEKYIEYLNGDIPALKDISLAQFTRRTRHAHQVFVVAKSKEKYVEALKSFVNDEKLDNVFYLHQDGIANPKVALMYSGQGGQWIQMGAALMKTEPVFKETIERFNSHFEKVSGWSVIDEINKSTDNSQINETTIVQPAIVAIQISLTELLKHYGINADGIVGHSIGEVSSAYASGAITLEQAAFVIFHRARIQDKASGKGRMLAIAVSAEEGEKLVEPFKDKISVATINSPQMITIAGDEEPLEIIAKQMEKDGVFNRFVNVKVPYHSYHMEPLHDELSSTLQECVSRSIPIPLYSTVTTKLQMPDAINGEYWYQNVRQTVRFVETIENMIDDGYNIFIEVGPHPVLATGAKDIIKDKGAQGIVATTMNKQQATSSFTHFDAITSWLSSGTMIMGCETVSKMIKLPTYPWQKQKYWYESNEEKSRRLTHQVYPFVKSSQLFVTDDSHKLWDIGISLGSTPYLSDHAVDGSVIYPAAAHMMMAFSAGKDMYGHDDLFIHDMRFEHALIVPDGKNSALDARLEVVNDEGSYAICTRNSDSDEDTPWTKHSYGKINYLRDEFISKAPDIKALKGEFKDIHKVNVDEFYGTIKEAGLFYGKTFQCIKEMWISGSNVLARLELDESLESEAHRYLIHPSVFDAHLQMTFADQQLNGNPNNVYLPNSIGATKVLGKATNTVWAYATVHQNDETWLCSNHFMFDDQMNLISELHGMAAKCIPSSNSSDDTAHDGVAEYIWVEDDQEEKSALETVEGEILHAIIIAEDNDQFCKKIKDAILLKRPEINVVLLGNISELDKAFDENYLDRRTHLIYVPNNTGQSLDHSSSKEYQKYLSLMQGMINYHSIANLFVFTENATNVDQLDKNLNLIQSPFFAMSRVFANEYPNLSVRVVDIDSYESVDDSQLAYELLRHDPRINESEVAIRKNKRYIRELEFVDSTKTLERDTLEVEASGGSYTAEFEQSGVIGEVAFRQLMFQPLKDNEIEIQVKSSALNYKDVMNAMGLLAKRAVSGGLAGDLLGLEVSGIVTSTGNTVSEFKPGDEVIARVANGFSGRCVTTSDCTVKKPNLYSFEQAASVPVVFLTAYYGLNYLGRMEEGETVLVHSATGGVGLAAIKLAQAIGVNVIGTAGTRKKRTQLRKMFGIEHVFDSRSNSFYSDVMKATEGKGVDLVLNSLTGKLITQSLKCLAPYGRFIEIGKTDIYGNTAISMESLGENISYHVVDVDRLAAQKPRLHQRLLNEVVSFINDKSIEAHPIISFSIAELDKALRQMTRAAHIGKFVVNMEGKINALPVNHYMAPSKGAVIITGGTSGLGLRIADWLSLRGATNLVLMSRSGVQSENDQAIINEIINRGTEVNIEHGDVSNMEDVSRVMTVGIASAGFISGVVHSAGVLDDSMIPGMTKERFDFVFNPKAVGAFNLHKFCIDNSQSPDLFLMISSMSSVLGLKGQINYASANYFEDSLSEYRRAIGMSGVSVNLGVLGEYAGMSMKEKDKTGVLGLLESNGLGSMYKVEVFSKIESAILECNYHRLCANIRWKEFGVGYPNLLRDSRFAGIFDSYEKKSLGKQKKGVTLNDQVFELEVDEQAVFLTNKIAAAIAELTGMPLESVSITESIDKWSLDSIMLGQISAWILKNTDINYPLIKLVKGPTLEEVSSEMLGQMKSSSNDKSSVETKEVGQDDGSLLIEMGAKKLSDWLIRGVSSGNESSRIICFHSMGVGASLFTNFLLNPPEDTDIIAIQTPGRENRSDEPVIKTVDEIVDNIVKEITPYLDKPFIIWGHSFGGIVAFETIRRLRGLDVKLPHHFMLTATIAPNLVKVWQNRDTLLRVLVEENRAEYLIALSRYIEDPEFIERILPVMRKDMPIMQSYTYREEDSLNIPITAWAAHQDDVVYLDEVGQWSEHTNNSFTMNEVEGDHWFLNSNKDKILARLKLILNNEEIK